MRLVEKRIAFNDKTFQPELIVTVAMPIELLKEDTLTVEQHDEKRGREIRELLEAKNK